ncbi:hypothetical protein P4S72_16965 [Vibrio sp. PP-XX7]
MVLPKCALLQEHNSPTQIRLPIFSLITLLQTLGFGVGMVVCSFFFDFSAGKVVIPFSYDPNDDRRGKLSANESGKTQTNRIANHDTPYAMYTQIQKWLRNRQKYWIMTAVWGARAPDTFRLEKQEQA